MAQAKKSDPYRKLLIITLILLVVSVLFWTGYTLLSKYQEGQHKGAVEKIAEENKQLEEEYKKKQAAWQAEQQVTPDGPKMPTPKAEGWDVVDLSDFAMPGGQTVQATREDMLMGGLTLINRWHALPADFVNVEPQLKSIGTETNFRVQVSLRVLSMFPDAVKSLDEMIKAAKADGQEHYIVREGFRSMQTQTELWNKELALYQDRYTGDQLIERARRAVSYPGTSDYQSGLSVQIGLYDKNDSVLNASKFNESAQCQWLIDRAHEFGYVLRFPVTDYPVKGTVDKSYKTGIDLRMNTWRYVGEPHARVMKELGLCLEEYIEYLIAHPHIAVYQDGVKKYEIMRKQGGLFAEELDLPQGERIFISTDNMEGLIAAVKY